MKTRYVRFNAGLKVFLVPLALKKYAERIRNSADSSDMVPEGAAVRIFPGRTNLHRKMTLEEAFKNAGFEMET